MLAVGPFNEAVRSCAQGARRRGLRCAAALGIWLAVATVNGQVPAGPAMSPPVTPPRAEVVPAPGAVPEPSAVLPSAGPPWPAAQAAAAPVDLPTWWDDAVRQPFHAQGRPLLVDLDNAVVAMLLYSPRVSILSDTPIVRATAVEEARARFDWRTFLDTKFTDTSDPVGNLLTTGGAPRFIDQTWYATGGLRKTNTVGGQVELSQRLGWQDNNSTFFVPPNQGTSRLSLNYTHPLLNGRGQVYNTSLICLSELAAGQSEERFRQELQDLLVDVYRAYWDLRLQRAVWLQRRRLFDEAVRIRDELRGRQDFDVVRSQVVRAEAAVAQRDAAVIRFATAVENAQARLRTLVNDPQLWAPGVELIPAETPGRSPVEIDLQLSLDWALQRRPELAVALKEIQAASLRAEVSRNELWPVLNLVMSTYVYGLDGNSDLATSWTRQFDDGRPTYAGGLLFEYPLGNRASQSRLVQRRVELRQATRQLQALTIEVRTEVEIALREVTTTHREMESRWQAMRAEQAEIDFLTERWRLLSGDGASAGVVLDDLLDAQERLAQAELAFATAEVAYNVAVLDWRRATGTLLEAEHIRPVAMECDGLPATRLERAPAFAPTVPGQPAATPVPPAMPHDAQTGGPAASGFPASVGWPGLPAHATAGPQLRPGLFAPAVLGPPGPVVAQPPSTGVRY